MSFTANRVPPPPPRLLPLPQSLPQSLPVLVSLPEAGAQGLGPALRLEERKRELLLQHQLEHFLRQKQQEQQQQQQQNSSAEGQVHEHIISVCAAPEAPAVTATVTRLVLPTRPSLQPPPLPPAATAAIAAKTGRPASATMRHGRLVRPSAAAAAVEVEGLLQRRINLLAPPPSRVSVATSTRPEPVSDAESKDEGSRVEVGLAGGPRGRRVLVQAQQLLTLKPFSNIKRFSTFKLFSGRTASAAGPAPQTAALVSALSSANEALAHAQGALAAAAAAHASARARAERAEAAAERAGRLRERAQKHAEVLYCIAERRRRAIVRLQGDASEWE